MAVVNKFRRNATDLDLDAAAGAGWRTVAWNPQVARVEEGEAPERVKEKVDLLADRSTQDTLATSVQALDQMMVWAAAYRKDRRTEYPVWWHRQMHAETGATRALVRAIDWEWLSPTATRVDWVEAGRALARMTVEREGAWERTTARDLPLAEPSAAASVSYDYTAAGNAVAAHDIVGDVGARLGLFDLYAPAASGDVGEVWIGIRSANKHGTPGNFINVWECEDGVNGTNAADAADSDASGGNRVTVTPGTATWAKRMEMYLGTVSANESDNFGDFQWLLRTMITAGTWEVQARFGCGNMADADFIQGPIVEVDWAAYDYVELGRAPIPLRDLHCIPQAVVGDSSESAWTIQIWARRTAGAGNLYLDCLCPVPLDEGWFHAWGFDLAPSTGGHLYFAESPEGIRQVVTIDSATINGFPPFESHNFRLPPGDGRMIIVYTGTDDSAILSYIGLSSGDAGKYTERWVNLRGGE